MKNQRGFFIGPVPVARLAQPGQVVAVYAERDALGRVAVEWQFDSDGAIVVTAADNLVLNPAEEVAA